MPMRIQDETADRGEALKDNLPGVPVSGVIVNSEVQELLEFRSYRKEFRIFRLRWLSVYGLNAFCNSWTSVNVFSNKAGKKNG
jgi:hypothetical protein